MKNEYQEALNELRQISASERQNKLYDTLQELVDITIPCKPEYDNCYFYEFKCECSSRLSGHEEFCPSCGQVLDWSSENE